MRPDVSMCFICRELVKNAWVDIERFKEQKDHDLREALISYAIMQISMCKKVSSIFTSAKKIMFLGAVCLSDFKQDCAKTKSPIFMKLGGSV